MKTKWLAAVGLLVMTGCKEGKDLQTWVDKVSGLRLTTLESTQTVPYRSEQHAALKAYFSEVGLKALALKDDPKQAQKLNAAVAQADLQAACAKVFVSKVVWLAMMEQCQRNSFFLCAEEVRAYPEMVTGFRIALTAENQRKFDQAGACSAAL